jgi:cob(I)alamin adenosyltransferase
MKIYTRTGDAGDTALFDGTRVKKDDARVDAYGEVDELNAWLGLARSARRPGSRRRDRRNPARPVRGRGRAADPTTRSPRV